MRHTLGGRRAAILAVACGGLSVSPSVAAQTTEIKMGCIAPEGSRYMREMHLISREIEHVSAGQVHFKWYAGGALGDEKTMAGMLIDNSGRLDGGGISTIGLRFVVPELSTWLLPAIFQDVNEVEHVAHLFRDEFSRRFEEHGLVLLTWIGVGFVHVFSQEPIRSLADLKKHTVTLWGDDEVAILAAESLGLKVKRAPKLGALIDDIRNHRVDAWMFPPLAVTGWGVHPHVKYMSELRFFYLNGGLVVRKDVFSSLSPALQQMLRAVGKRSEARLIRTLHAENEAAVMAMEKQGLKVVRVTAEERERFFQEASQTHTELAKRWHLEDLVRRFDDELRRHRESRRGR